VLLERTISFHRLEGAVYESRTNHLEAEYTAQLIRELLARKAGQSIGIVAFSEAQQDEIEGALRRLGESDAEFRAALDAEMDRTEGDQFCGLFVKNLENVQGDERDIIVLSICYGPDAQGRMKMNFGPITGISRTRMCRVPSGSSGSCARPINWP
jgi:superfamily I DNA and/or RNA helicase